MFPARFRLNISLRGVDEKSIANSLSCPSTFQSPTSISRVLSSVSGTSLVIPKSFWVQAIERIIKVLKNPSRSSLDVASSVHVIDRIAAFSQLDAPGLDELISTFPASRVCRTDAWLGAKAGLLLGYPEFACSLLTKSHLSAFSFSNLVSLASLLAPYALQTEGETVKLVGEEICLRLLGEELHACGSVDLVTAVSFIGASGMKTANRALKKAGTELIRRIELYTLSPHSMVSVLESSSGLPPSLVQAAQAFLLEQNRFQALSRNELAVVLHAIALSEIENVILSREIVKFLVEEAPPHPQPHENDPRTELRILSAVSILKSFFPATYVRRLSCKIADSIKSLDDHQSTLLTAFLNLSTSSVCRHSLNSVIRRINVEKLDLEDSACFFLLQVLAQQPGTEQVEGCLIPAPAAGHGNKYIYPDAMEITEKANSAFPRSDPQKAKRLMKRVEQRFDSMFDTPDLVWNNPNTMKCPSDCSQAACGHNSGVMLKTITRCVELIETPSSVERNNDLTGIARDLLSGICLLDKDIHSLPITALRDLDKLTSFARTILCDSWKHAHNDNDDDSIESWVFRDLTSMGFSPELNVQNSHLRVSIVV
jgi:hypothetical protein